MGVTARAEGRASNFSATPTWRAGGVATTDVFSKEKRSDVMRRIKNRDTGIELATAEILRQANIGHESHPEVYGSPDFLVEGKLALFCDGSFWHGRDWKNLKEKLSSGNNPDYWVNHIGSNRKRDRKVNRALRERGYAVLRLWDTDIKKRPERCVNRIRKALDSGAPGSLATRPATRSCLSATHGTVGEKDN